MDGWWWWWWGVPPDRGFSLKVSVCGLWGRIKPASLSLANYHAAFVVRLWCIRGRLGKRGRAVPIQRTKRNCVRVSGVGGGGALADPWPSSQRRHSNPAAGWWWWCGVGAVTGEGPPEMSKNCGQVPSKVPSLCRPPVLASRCRHLSSSPGVSSCGGP